MNGKTAHVGFAEVIVHLYRFTVPAYTSVAAPSGTASNSRLYAPCWTPHPSTSPQFVMPESDIGVHDAPPFTLCHMPPSTVVPVGESEMYHAYISLRPGTAVISPR